MLTQERLKELLHYNPDTGVFTWRSGRVAGNSSGRYTRIVVDKKRYRAHRLVWLYEKGYFPEHEMDHINEDKKDNRLLNLREVNRSCNQKNAGNQANNSSGVKGVQKHLGNKWIARIKENGKTIHLGLHSDFVEAVAHRLAGEQCLNFQNCNSSSPAYQYMQSVI